MSESGLHVLIRQLQGALSGKGMRSGSTTCTFTAATQSDTQTVTHGFSSAPKVQVSVDSLSAPIHATFGNVGATSFQVTCWSDAAHTGAVTVHWHAIG